MKIILSFLRTYWPQVVCVVAFVALLLLLSGCTTTKYVEVERVRTDTAYVAKIQRDSVWLHDSVFVERFFRGDTVFELRDRWHVKYVERLRTDTVFRQRVDSVPVPYAVEVEVERKLSWWQRLRMGLGSVALAGLIVLVVYGCWRIRDKLLVRK